MNTETVYLYDDEIVNDPENANHVRVNEYDDEGNLISIEEYYKDEKYQEAINPEFESKHPRDADGKFASKGGGSGTARDEDFVPQQVATPDQEIDHVVNVAGYDIDIPVDADEYDVVDVFLKKNNLYHNITTAEIKDNETHPQGWKIEQSLVDNVGTTETPAGSCYLTTDGQWAGGTNVYGYDEDHRPQIRKALVYAGIKLVDENGKAEGYSEQMVNAMRMSGLVRVGARGFLTLDLYHPLTNAQRRAISDHIIMNGLTDADIEIDTNNVKGLDERRILRQIGAYGETITEAMADPEFESKHPRDADGKFAPKGGGSEQKQEPAKLKPKYGYVPFGMRKRAEGGTEEPIELTPQPSESHKTTAREVNDYWQGKFEPQFLEEQALKADYLRNAHQVHAKAATTMLSNAFPQHRTSYRIKKRYNMLEKLGRKGHYKDVTELGDISGVRTQVENIQDLPAVAQFIENNFNVKKAEYLVDTPRNDGYRGIQYDIENPDGSVSEYQVRTYNQNTWADWSHDFTYKPPTEEHEHLLNRDKANIMKYAVDMSEYFYQLDRGTPIPQPECPESLRTFGGCL